MRRPYFVIMRAMLPRRPRKGEVRLAPTAPLIPSILLLSVILLAACGPFGRGAATATPALPTQTPAPPTLTPVPAAATVNGEVIPLADFQAELERYKAAQTALGKTVSDQDAAQTVIEDLIAQTLLAQAAAKAGFTLDDAALQGRIDTLAEQVGGADVLSKWESEHGYTDESFRAGLRRAGAAAWQRDQIIAAVPTSQDQVHVRQILIYNQERASQVYEDLIAGRTDFDDFAALVDPIAAGDIGWFPRGYLPYKQIEQAAFALQPDQMSDVTQTELGFHILKVIERGQRPLSPDALITLQDQALRDWVTQQRQQSQIVITP
jgi:peptidyl-prolyl cis-trans isomerase C